MARSATSSLYLRVRRWVDRQFHPAGDPKALVFPPMPFALLALMIGGWRVGPAAPGVYAAIGIYLAWSIFVGWRWVRMMRTIALRRDRRFDREGRFELPPEYRDTHSATKARSEQRQSRRHPERR